MIAENRLEHSPIKLDCNLTTTDLVVPQGSGVSRTDGWVFVQQNELF